MRVLLDPTAWEAASSHVPLEDSDQRRGVAEQVVITYMEKAGLGLHLMRVPDDHPLKTPTTCECNLFKRRGVCWHTGMKP